MPRRTDSHRNQNSKFTLNPTPAEPVKDQEATPQAETVATDKTAPQPKKPTKSASKKTSPKSTGKSKSTIRDPFGEEADVASPNADALPTVGIPQKKKGAPTGKSPFLNTRLDPEIANAFDAALSAAQSMAVQSVTKSDLTRGLLRKGLHDFAEAIQNDDTDSIDTLFEWMGVTRKEANNE